MNQEGKLIYGIALIIMAVFMMSIQDALFKYLSSDYSLWQIFSLRALMTLPLFILIFRLQNQPKNIWRIALRFWAIIRALLFTLSFIALYAAMPFVSLSTVAAGYYTAPIFIAILSVLFLGERIGMRGWLAVAIGFIGVLVILRPGSDAFSPWTALPVLGGFSYALANIVTRSKCLDFPATALALSLNITLLLIGCLVTLLLFIVPLSPLFTEDFPFLLAGWSVLHPTAWGWLAATAILVIAIATSVARAYQIASPPSIATFEYCYLIFVALWDLWIFNAPPSYLTLLGIGLIVASGIIVSHQSKNNI